MPRRYRDSCAAAMIALENVLVMFHITAVIRQPPSHPVVSRVSSTLFVADIPLFPSLLGSCFLAVISLFFASP
jgi:hypothetical protein